MTKVLQYYFIILLLLSCSGCDSRNSKVKIEYYPNGNLSKIYSEFNGKKNGKSILYFEDGSIKGIINYQNDYMEGEQLSFYDSNNVLKSKLMFKKDIPIGVAYWFYKSGALKSSRNMENGKEWYLGFDYWDDSFVINKALLRFRNGKVYYKLNFDSSGKPLNSEGKER